MATKTKTYQLKVTLVGSKPPIWRRLLVPSTINLHKLHYVLQTVMGWEGGHLHQFIIHGEYYGVPDDGFEDEMLDETKVKLNQALQCEKESIVYEYDFGDSWKHKIVLEKILPPDPTQPLPRCVTGKRACPPEDCGGIWGYADLVQIMADPKHPEYADTLTWLGGDFDPEYFDLEAVNETLTGA